MLATPDEIQGKLYKNHIHNTLKSGAALAFAHGLNIHYGLIEPREDIDVFMIAPKGPDILLDLSIKKGGVPSLISVFQDKSGNAFEIALAYGSGLGAGRSGMIQTTFREECETDLFGEQVVLVED